MENSTTAIAVKTSKGLYEVETDGKYITIRKFAGEDILAANLHEIVEFLGSLGTKVGSNFGIFSCLNKQQEGYVISLRIGMSGCEDYLIGIERSQSGLIINPTKLRVSMYYKVQIDCMRVEHLNVFATFCKEMYSEVEPCNPDIYRKQDAWIVSKGEIKDEGIYIPIPTRIETKEELLENTFEE
jgi:hypothetical protein